MREGHLIVLIPGPHERDKEHRLARLVRADRNGERIVIGLDGQIIEVVSPTFMARVVGTIQAE